MLPVNPNKLFPRLSIRVKLAVAFAAIAVVPLALVAGLTIRVTVARLWELTRVTLGHDVDTTVDQAEHLIGMTQRQVGYVAMALVPPGAQPLTPEERTRIGAFLQGTPALFRIKVFSAEGMLRGVVYAAGDSVPGDGHEAAGGEYYLLRASALRTGEQLVLPVEIAVGDANARRPLPAIAIVAPLLRDGELTAVVVGEARAATLLAALDHVAPQFPGTTVLADAEGKVLYHSERKRDWSSLLDDSTGPLPRSEGTGADGDFSLVSGEDLVVGRPLRLGTAASPELRLLRLVPRETLTAPLREFMANVAVTGMLTVAAVLALALLAARQLTGPLYRLRTAARKLAQGAPGGPLEIATNDEIEDLAADFNRMAGEITRHRQELESAVTERTRSLVRTHAELALVLNHSADAIVALDAGERIRMWNEGATRLFGYTAVEAIGRRAEELLLPPESGEAEGRFLRRELAAHGAVVNLATQRRARDGTVVPVSLTQTALHDEAGRLQGYSLILRDTSQQSRVDEQMRRSERLAAVSVLAAGLAHEINNPLAIIGNRLECMERELDAGPDTLRRDLAVLRQHTTRLGDVAHNLLRFARDYDQTPAPVALEPMVRRLATLLERTLVGRRVVIQVEAEPGSAPAWGSEPALETVALNLILNAADAMPGGGTVTVILRGGPIPDRVELEVRDEGTGVPEAVRDRIFEPFFSTKDESHGTGLGLAVCRSIVERLGGRIRLEPAHPVGSRFIVTLPVAMEATV